MDRPLSASSIKKALARFTEYEYKVMLGFVPEVRKFLIMTYMDMEGRSPSRPRILVLCMKFSLEYQWPERMTDACKTQATT